MNKEIFPSMILTGQHHSQIKLIASKLIALDLECTNRCKKCKHTIMNSEYISNGYSGCIFGAIFMSCRGSSRGMSMFRTFSTMTSGT